MAYRGEEEDIGELCDEAEPPVGSHPPAPATGSRSQHVPHHGADAGTSRRKRPRAVDAADAGRSSSPQATSIGSAAPAVAPLPTAAAPTPHVPPSDTHHAMRLLGEPKFMSTRTSLPVYAHAASILAAFKSSRVVILVGETGSGKTTQVPQYLHTSGVCAGGVIVVTQPRRVAAITVARRVAAEMGVHVGSKVGYSVRFDERYSHTETRLKYATDGMLLREAQLDPTLSRYSCIILDEAHERSLATDILTGVVSRALHARPQLRVCIMSATLDTSRFESFFAAYAPVTLRVPGRAHSVSMHYASAPVEDYVDAAVDTVLRVCEEYTAAEREGDILLFLPGVEEIHTAVDMIHARVAAKRAAATVRTGPGADAYDVRVTPLYAHMSADAQAAVFEPAAPQRKIIVATNIAETSVTIPGVVCVIDTGKVKLKMLTRVGEDASTATADASGSAAHAGIESLVCVDISRASADQRAGRAGRERAGECYRLYSHETYERMAAHTIPEIARVRLSSVVSALLCMRMSVRDTLAFPWIQAPSQHALVDAVRELYTLGALKEVATPAGERDYILSDDGKRMCALPLSPMHASILMHACAHGCVSECVDIVSLLCTDTPIWVHTRGDTHTRIPHAYVALDGDHISMLNAFRAFHRACVTAYKDTAAQAAAMHSSVAPPLPLPKKVNFFGDAAGRAGVADDDVDDDDDERAPRAASAAQVLKGKPTSGAHGSKFPSPMRDMYATADMIADAAADTAAKLQPHTCSDACVCARTRKRVKAAFIRDVRSRLLEWCERNSLSYRAITQALEVRDQIADVCSRNEIVNKRACACVGSCACFSQTLCERVLRSIAGGCATHAAYLCAHSAAAGDTGARLEYDTLTGVRVVVHPSSAMAMTHTFVRGKRETVAKRGETNASIAAALAHTHTHADTLIYDEVIHTKRAYMRIVSRVTREWIPPAVLARFKSRDIDDVLDHIRLMHAGEHGASVDIPRAAAGRVHSRAGVGSDRRAGTAGAAAVRSTRTAADVSAAAIGALHNLMNKQQRKRQREE